MNTDDAPQVVRDFAAARISHPTIDAALADALRKTRAGATRNFVLLYGPSGVGKTALLQRLVRDVEGRERARMAADPQLRPVIHMSASGPTGPFDLFSFFLDALAKLGEPAVDDRKVRWQPGRPGQLRLRSPEDARRQFREATKDRKTRVAVIDESYHLRHGIRTEEALLERMDLLKSLAEETGIVFVLAGTYQMLELRNVSEQLGRRAAEVHFPRYAATDEGQKGFGLAYARLLKKIGHPVDPDVDSYVFDMFERTVGCVGHLKDWLVEALWMAVDDGAPLSRRHLEQRRPHIDAVIRAAEVIAEGERDVEETPEKQARLRALLGFARPDVELPGEAIGAAATDGSSAERRTPASPDPERSARSRRGPKPGRRRVVRDRARA